MMEKKEKQEDDTQKQIDGDHCFDTILKFECLFLIIMKQDTRKAHIYERKKREKTEAEIKGQHFLDLCFTNN